MARPGATLRYIVYDLLHDFKQLFADADITPYQITYWTLIHADRLKKQHIQKIDSGEYIHEFSVSIQLSSAFGKYIELPARIYDYDLDKGVAYINLVASEPLPGVDQKPGYITTTFSRTTAASSRVTYFREEEIPSLTNPYFYRVNDNLRFLGLDDLVLPRSVNIGLYSTLDPTDLTLDIDQSFDFPQDLIPVLKRQVLDLGMFVMNVPKDLINDGVDMREAVPQKKFISVNDLNQEQS